MYELSKDKSFKCKFCDFAEEFRYEWSKDAFLVICPSCGKVNYEVSRGKIEALTQDVVKESLEDLKKSKNWQT